MRNDEKETGSVACGTVKEMPGAWHECPRKRPQGGDCRRGRSCVRDGVEVSEGG